MEYRLNEEVDKPGSAAPDGYLPDDDGYYHAPEQEPVRIATPSASPARRFHIPKFVLFFVAAVLIAFVLTRIPWNHKTSLDTLLRLPKEELEQELGITLEEHADRVSYLSIPNRDTTGFQVYATPQEDFGVIYYNGAQTGICFDSRKYSLYGVTIGDSESHLLTQAEETQTIAEDGSAGYSYTQFFTMLEDMQQKSSTAEYFMGTDGSVLVLVINDTSNRVVNVLYYYDSKRIMQDVDML